MSWSRAARATTIPRVLWKIADATARLGSWIGDRPLVLIPLALLPLILLGLSR